MADFHVIAPGEAADDRVEVRRIEVDDILDALRRGRDDFLARPTHYAFTVVIYPIIGVLLFAWIARGDALQLIYPLVMGFALLGPIAALPLYELSRRLERRKDVGWRHAFAAVRSPALPSIGAVGLWLLVIFFVWIYTAEQIFQLTYEGASFASVGALFGDVVSTSRGWTLLLIGNAVGLVFALVAFCTTVVAFPLLLDRDVGAAAAISASVRAVRQSPLPLFLWGLIIAALLVLGALPFMAGLIVVLPLLGHTTWHVYRKVVVEPRRAG